MDHEGFIESDFVTVVPDWPAAIALDEHHAFNGTYCVALTDAQIDALRSGQMIMSGAANEYGILIVRVNE